MKTKRISAALGASVALIAVALLVNQASVHMAVAQQTTGGTTQDQDLNTDTSTQETDVRQDTVTGQQETTRQGETTQTRQNRTTRDDQQRGTGLFGQRDAKRHRDAFRASELIGMNVRGRTGDDDIGSIDDLMIHRSGKVNYVAVSFGGFLGIGDKKFAVPMEAIEFVRTEDETYARMDVSEQTLEAKEGFNEDNWPEHANEAFLRNRGERQVERPTSPGQQQDLTR